MRVRRLEPQKALVKANWSKIINSQCREDAEKDNKAKAKIIIADDHRKYNNAMVTKPAKVKDAVSKDAKINPAVKQGLADDKLFDEPIRLV